MLKHRIISGCLLGAALVLSANYMPRWGIWALLMWVAALGQLEFYQLLARVGIPCFRYVGMASGVALISVTSWFAGLDAASLARCYRMETMVLAVTLILVFVRQFPQKHNPRPLETIGCTLLGIWYVPYLWNFLTRLVYIWQTSPSPRVSNTGRMLMLYLVVVVKMGDVGQYFTGLLMGRHKLFPRVSPGKTWEGLIGGWIVAMVTSLGFSYFNNGSLGVLRFPPAHALLLGFLLCSVGVVGDLFESLLKRAAGLKDSSHAIPGMGGVLDVIDSLLFGAPVLYAYIHLGLSVYPLA